MEINNEMNEYQEMSKNAEKSNQIKDLKRRNETSPLKKSQSEALIQNKSMQMQEAQEPDETETKYMHLFYQKVCTSNVDHPQKQKTI